MRRQSSIPLTSTTQHEQADCSSQQHRKEVHRALCCAAAGIGHEPNRSKSRQGAAGRVHSFWVPHDMYMAIQHRAASDLTQGNGTG